jgi:hypothetical protein
LYQHVCDIVTFVGEPFKKVGGEALVGVIRQDGTGRINSNVKRVIKSAPAVVSLSRYKNV